MMIQIKSVIRNSHATLMQDFCGAAVLIVMMLIALHVPGIA